MTEQSDETKLAADEPNYLERRRDLMKKLAAGTLATPVVLSSVTMRAGAASTFSPPPS